MQITPTFCVSRLPLYKMGIVLVPGVGCYEYRDEFVAVYTGSAASGAALTTEVFKMSYCVCLNTVFVHTQNSVCQLIKTYTLI